MKPRREVSVILLAIGVMIVDIGSSPANRL
jgi:hypothetical protein